MSDALRWTTDIPTEPGWYWMRSSKLRPEVCHVYESQFGRGLSVARVYHDEIETLSEFVLCRRNVEWAGPIPMPEEPND